MQINSIAQQMWAGIPKNAMNKGGVDYQSINLKPPSDPMELKARANSTASAGDVLVLSKDNNGSITSRPMYTREQYQSGQVTELNMKSLEIRLSMASYGGMGYGVDSIAETADELAATYVAYRTHIDKYEPEETKAAEFEKLDNLIRSSMEKFAQSFTDDADTFLREGGIDGERDNLYKSVMGIFENRIAEYQAFSDANPDYAGVKGTSDEWMQTNADFMSGMLRYSMSVQKPDMVTSSEHYSADDLKAIGMMARATNESKINYGESDNGRDLFSADIASYAMKKEITLRTLQMSDSVRKMIDRAFGKIVSTRIDDVNGEMEKYRNEKGVFGEKEYRYRAYDKSGILDMVNSVIQGMSEDNAKDSKLLQSLMPAMFQEGASGIRSSIAQRYNDFAKALGVTELLSHKTLNVSM